MGYLEDAISVLTLPSHQDEGKKSDSYETCELSVTKSPGIDFKLPHWRAEIASWPHDRWVVWRHQSGELQSALGVERPTVDEIAAADYQTYLDMKKGE